jgi:Ca-activated chloride channel family protein
LGAGPQGSGIGRTAPPQSAALVIVLDISSSMTSADFAPLNRLEAARESLRSFIGQLPNVGVGLVSVAGAPFLAAPVTEEHSFVLRVLDRLRPAGFGEDGTALGTGLASAINRIRGGSWSSRRILLVTDGVSNRGALSPADAAALCRELGIRVDAIGLGTDQVSRFVVPVSDGQGQEVDAKIEIDDDALARMAAKAGGSYRRARNRAELAQALAQVRASFDSPMRDAGFRWIPFVAPAVLLLLALEVLLIQLGFCELPQ